MNSWDSRLRTGVLCVLPPSECLNTALTTAQCISGGGVLLIQAALRERAVCTVSRTPSCWMHTHYSPPPPSSKRPCVMVPSPPPPREVARGFVVKQMALWTRVCGWVFALFLKLRKPLFWPHCFCFSMRQVVSAKTLWIQTAINFEDVWPTPLLPCSAVGRSGASRKSLRYRSVATPAQSFTYCTPPPNITRQKTRNAKQEMQTRGHVNNEMTRKLPARMHVQVH